VPLTWDNVALYLRQHYIANAIDVQRRIRHRERHELYMGGGDHQIHRVIDAVYTKPEIRQKLKGFVALAKYNNISRRIINEQSSVYNVQAKRTVAGKDNNARYKLVQRDARQHETMQRINRWGNLHRNLAVGFAIRDEGFRRIPVLRVVTPDCFVAIAHPKDATRLIAIGIEHRSADGVIRWVVWSDTEVFQMTQRGLIDSGSIVEHGFARNPWLLFSLEPPHGALLDSTTMEDLAAAHRAEWFLQVRILKESKSATKIPVIQGDETAMARNQAADSEGVLVLPQGTNTTSLDMSVDRAPFEKTSNYIYETAAGNNGIPPTILHHQGVQSAEARELMRVPLMELRREQTIPSAHLSESSWACSRWSPRQSSPRLRSARRDGASISVRAAHHSIPRPHSRYSRNRASSG